VISSAVKDPGDGRSRTYGEALKVWMPKDAAMADFLRLANALSALAPNKGERKRLGVLCYSPPTW
jgi:hypothetical protein